MAGEWIEDAKNLVKGNDSRKMSIHERRRKRIEAEAMEDKERAAAVADATDDIGARLRNIIQEKQRAASGKHGSKPKQAAKTPAKTRKKQENKQPEECNLAITMEDRARSLNLMPKDVRQRVHSSRDRLADHVIALERALAGEVTDIRPLDTSTETLMMLHVFGQDMMTDAECAGIFGIGAVHFRAFMEENPIAQIAYNRGYTARMRQMRKSYFNQAAASPTLMAQFARNYMDMNKPVAIAVGTEEEEADVIDESVEAAAEEMRARMHEVLSRAVARDAIEEIEEIK